MKLVKVAGACVNQTPLDWVANTDRLIAAIREAKQREVSILCLPELSICGYGCEDAFFSDYVLEYSLEQLSRIIPETQGMVVSVGLPMLVENCLYNVSCLMCDGKVIGFVPKQELAGDGVYYEPRWFKPWPDDLVIEFEWQGETYAFGDLVFEVGGVRIGFEICEDAWNGVRPAQDHYLRNVDVILNPSASNFAFGKSRIRKKLVEETSRSYTCAYVYSNLLGNGSGRLIWDGEILVAQGGVLLASNDRFSFEDFQVLDVVIDVESIRRLKKKSFNFEPDFDALVFKYDFEYPAARLSGEKNLSEQSLTKEEEFLQAVTLALFDYMRKSYSRGFVISLSGGADSSTCAVVTRHTFLRALEELGEEKLREKLAYWKSDRLPKSEEWLTCVYQATSNSSDETETSARELANAMGATWYRWDVQDLFDNYRGMAEESIERKLDWGTDDLTLQNIQARLRAPGIWMIANINRALLVTTSNRSEAAVGYATMDGDTAGGIMPLGGVDKAFIQHWLKWAEQNLNITALQHVNSLAPTAELRPDSMDQTDEGDLMPYTILDEIEKCAIRDYKSPVEVFQTLQGIVPDDILKDYIRKFFLLWSRNQWKRERYAPSFHLDDENLDPKTWCRFPILNGGFSKGLKDLEDIS